MGHDYFSFSQIATKLHEVSSMFETYAILRREIGQKSLPIYTCNFHREFGRAKNYIEKCDVCKRPLKARQNYKEIKLGQHHQKNSNTKTVNYMM